METIFDHNVTEKEITRFGGELFLSVLKMLDYKNNPKCKDLNNYCIGVLYEMRGDDEKKNEYFNKMEDKSFLRCRYKDVKPKSYYKNK